MNALSVESTGHVGHMAYVPAGYTGKSFIGQLSGSGIVGAVHEKMGDGCAIAGIPVCKAGNTDLCIAGIKTHSAEGGFHRRYIGSVPSGNVEIGKKTASVEHVGKIIYGGGIPFCGPFQSGQGRAILESHAHAVYGRGIPAGQVQRGKRTAVVEHAADRPEGRRVPSADPVQGLKRRTQLEHAGHVDSFRSVKIVKADRRAAETVKQKRAVSRRVNGIPADDQISRTCVGADDAAAAGCVKNGAGRKCIGFPKENYRSIGGCGAEGIRIQSGSAVCRKAGNTQNTYNKYEYKHGDRNDSVMPHDSHFVPSFHFETADNWRFISQ